MSNPTLQNVKDFAAINMIPEKIAEQYWMNFECQDWIRANNQKITKWQVHFKWWFQSGCWKSKNKKEKQKLYPIKGKFCAEKVNGRRCGMPAVYISGGDYTNYYCKECMPEKVKAKYE